MVAVSCVDDCLHSNYYFGVLIEIFSSCNFRTGKAL